MKTQQVLEYSEPGVRGNVIRGVKIIGTTSRNGRTYPLPVLQEAIPLYEDAPVFLTHGDAGDKRRRSRRLNEHFGSLEKVHGNGKGLFGDLRVKASHSLAKPILEAAATGKFGLSHNAIVNMTDDEKTVTEIVEVRSVDLVDSPGTSKNLFEGTDMTDTAIADPEREDSKSGTEEEGLELMQLIKSRFDALEAKLVTEGEEKKPPKRLTALEDKTVEEGEAPAIGNTHDDFLDTLRGFPVTN